MAMICCHKEYAEECEIVVCKDAPAPLNPGLYQRLRFGLLASSWLPSPLGIFLWSALHVMLLVFGGPVLWVLVLLTAFLFSSVFFSVYVSISLCIIYAVVIGLIAVPGDLFILLVQSIALCLSSPPPLDNWCLTVRSWKEFKSIMSQIFSNSVRIGVPCMSDSLYKRTKNRQLRTWARWCEEVVHTHDAIAL